MYCCNNTLRIVVTWKTIRHQEVNISFPYSFASLWQSAVTGKFSVTLPYINKQDDITKLDLLNHSGQEIYRLSKLQLFYSDGELRNVFHRSILRFSWELHLLFSPTAGTLLMTSFDVELIICKAEIHHSHVQLARFRIRRLILVFLGVFYPFTDVSDRLHIPMVCWVL